MRSATPPKTRRAPKLLTYALALSTILAPAKVQAHLLPVGNASLNIVNHKAYLALSVPVDVFSTIPSCADGVLTRKELAQDRDEIKEAIHRGLIIQSKNPVALSSVLLNLPTGYRRKPEESAELLIMAVAPLDDDSNATVRWLYWSEELERLHLQATKTVNQNITQAERAELTPDHPEFTFSGSSLRRGVNWLALQIKHTLTKSPLARLLHPLASRSPGPS